jgi:hypothetical protein
LEDFLGLFSSHRSQMPHAHRFWTLDTGDIVIDSYYPHEARLAWKNWKFPPNCRQQCGPAISSFRTGHADSILWRRTKPLESSSAPVDMVVSSLKLNSIPSSLGLFEGRMLHRDA